MNDTHTATTPFWRFSLKFYGQSGVSDACIALQDGCGIDVNLLLFLFWLASERQVLSADDGDGSCRSVSREKKASSPRPLLPPWHTHTPEPPEIHSSSQRG